MIPQGRPAGDVPVLGAAPGAALSRQRRAHLHRLQSHRVMTDTPSDDDIVQLARQAGLDLPAEFMPELIEAYGHVRRMTGAFPDGAAARR